LLTVSQQDRGKESRLEEMGKELLFPYHNQRRSLMSIRTRLQYLEQRVPETGCPACRDRFGRVVLVTTRQLADGTMLPTTKMPEPCSLCGQLPEEIIKIVEVVVETREQANEINANVW
jgi:hypothetical protein